jgi:hypothetical protein
MKMYKTFELFGISFWMNHADQDVKAGIDLKTPTEDSRLRHERTFFINFGIIGKLACLLLNCSYHGPTN